MYSIKVISIEKANRVGTDVGVLEVTAGIYEDGNLVVERRYEYPLDTPKEAVEGSIAKALDTFVSEKKAAEKSAEVAKLNENADQVISDLSGLEIKQSAEQNE